VPVFFSGGVSRGQGTKSQEIFPSPAGQRFLINGRMHRVFARQGTLVPATPGWETCGSSRSPAARIIRNTPEQTGLVVAFALESFELDEHDVTAEGEDIGSFDMAAADAASLIGLITGVVVHAVESPHFDVQILVGFPEHVSDGVELSKFVRVGPFALQNAVIADCSVHGVCGEFVVAGFPVRRIGFVGRADIRFGRIHIWPVQAGLVGQCRVCGVELWRPPTYWCVQPARVRVSPVGVCQLISVIIHVHVHCDADLFEVVDASGALCFFLGARKRWQQQTCEDCNDCNYDQKLDQCEACPGSASWA